jgi:hypothetical protein
MTKFITQGTMMYLAEEGATEFSVWIDPTQDFTVKYRKDEYVVFVPEEAVNAEITDTIETKIFKKEHMFSLSKELEEFGKCCNSDKTRIEIGIDNKGKIVSLKVPASF